MLQSGDVVWIREQLIDRPEEAIDPDDAVYIDWGGTPMWAEPRFVMPDVPNLAHIARFLAEHPETVDALGRVAEYHRSLDFLDDKLDDDATEAGEQLAQWLADYGNARDVLTTVDTAAVIGLAAAMRGEGGHE